MNISLDSVALPSCCLISARSRFYRFSGFFILFLDYELSHPAWWWMRD